MHMRFKHLFIFNFMLVNLFAAASISAWALPDKDSRLQHHALPATIENPDAANAHADFGRVSLMAATIAQELSQACPFTDAADQKALEVCKAKLYGDSVLRKSLAEYLLWGRLRDATLPLKETGLTQFGRDVFTAAYLPLFMFNGVYSVIFDEREKMYRVELVTAFRNRLAPGQFPYPFWHDENKWAIYQGANQLTMWVGVDNGGQGKISAEHIKVMQFSTFGKNHGGIPAAITKPEFTAEQKQWMWTDSAGKTQPAVTLFDNLYNANNPNLKKLDATYRAVALELRNAECLNCHVPDNPDKSKRLVLLQTPAHAEAEMSRVIKSVRQGRMPLDEIGIEKHMPDNFKNHLLSKAEAFAEAIHEAKIWEADNSAKRISP